MNFSTILFDLDATLYAADNGLWPAIGKRISEYLRTEMQIPEPEIAPLQRRYYQTYGTTLRGLQLHHRVDTQHYLSFVHDIPLEQYLLPDPELRDVLEAIPQKRFIFTNSDRSHTLRVLNALGIAGCFDGLITIEAMNYYCKPNPEAYEAALKISGEADAHKLLFLDDTPRNLIAAQRIGMFTVLVGADQPDGSADRAILRPHDLLTAFPDLIQLNGSGPLK